MNAVVAVSSVTEKAGGTVHHPLEAKPDELDVFVRRSA
jgi:hypothetical protein